MFEMASSLVTIRFCDGVTEFKLAYVFVYNACSSDVCCKHTFQIKHVEENSSGHIHF